MSSRAKQNVEERVPDAICGLLMFGCCCGWRAGADAGPYASGEWIPDDVDPEVLADWAVARAIDHAKCRPVAEAPPLVGRAVGAPEEHVYRERIAEVQAAPGAVGKFRVNADGSIEFVGRG